MSKIALQGNALGTGVFTIASPNSSTDRTFNLPDKAGTVALTSDIGLTLLGTLTTTSGTRQTLIGLDLTAYKSLVIYWNNMSWNSANNTRLNSVSIAPGTSTAGGSTWGWATVDLSLGTFIGGGNDTTATTGTTSAGIGVMYSGNCGITTASTSLAFSGSAGGTFDLGTIKVYGV